MATEQLQLFSHSIPLSEIPLKVIRRKGTKRLRLTVNSSGLRVSAPKRYSWASLEAFIMEHRGWIEETYGEYYRAENIPVDDFIRRKRYYINGRVYRLRLDPTIRGKCVLDFDRKIVRIKPALRTVQEIRMAVELEYRKHAKEILPPKIDAFARVMRVRYNGIRFKNLESRWGNCSSKGNLNFNIKLLMLPEEVRDYVIVHELAHLKELNHSPKFWAIVAKACPQYKRYVKHLTDHSSRYSF